LGAAQNAGTHDMSRALAEAADLNDFFNLPSGFGDRIYGRTASFCTQYASNYDVSGG
jgi:hypothetical protein